MSNNSNTTSSHHVVTATWQNDSDSGSIASTNQGNKTEQYAIEKDYILSTQERIKYGGLLHKAIQCVREHFWRMDKTLLVWEMRDDKFSCGQNPYKICLLKYLDLSKEHPWSGYIWRYVLKKFPATFRKKRCTVKAALTARYLRK